MKGKERRTSGFEKEHLRLMKYASVESKFHALTEMAAFAKEARKSCEKRGAKVLPM
ncbi:MAG: hypothetical protein PHZ00_07715 [Candidatus Peribacteraceae bacterium]|nr:hypothetical protein [Candidatus Peribacteraceae bacterium]